MKKSWLLIALALNGCATTYKDFTHPKPGQAAVIGRLNLTFKGENLGEKCSVCFNSVNGPCQKLTSEGYIFEGLPPGPASIQRVQCQDSSPHHYNIEGATFVVKEGVNYFGNVRISWQAKGGFKASSLFGLVGAIADESSNDGAIKMEVNDMEWEQVVKIFRRQTGSNEKVRKTIVKEGK